MAVVIAENGAGKAQANAFAQGKLFNQFGYEPEAELFPVDVEREAPPFSGNAQAFGLPGVLAGRIVFEKLLKPGA
ncbi:MAG: hypothetical protein LLG06_13110 [Desulfobacteraceae bacterium]|nr:hypothetical protein [Desulfobacteraceae bacterium]